jgi:hypothetical protein
MVALPLKLTRPRKSRNQPLAFKTLRNFNNCLRSGRFVRALTGGVSRFESAATGSATSFARFDFATTRLCFNSVSCAKRNGSVAEALLGRTIAKD